MPFLFLFLLLQAAEHHHHSMPAPAPAVEAETPEMKIADVPVVDQDGRPLHFYSDLVKGRAVAINTIFTSCTTICPTLGATFAKTQELRPDASLLSISIDPAYDTPARLAAWRAKLGGKPGWTLVTGKPEDIATLLRSLGVYVADKSQHAPLVVVGDDRSGKWQRMTGFTSPQTIADALPPTAAAQYFGKLTFVDQDGKTVDLYGDLIRNRTVVINSFFASCQGSCPVMASTLAAMQKRYGDRVGKDLLLVSISVDPENDTPPKLREFARHFGAQPGWVFLTGSRAQVDAGLRKLGLHTDTREAHMNLMLIGNDRTGLWKKAMGLASAPEVLKVVDSVLNDQGSM